MRDKRVILRFSVILCFLCFELSVPNFAIGDSTKASPTPATDKPKMEEPTKSTPAPVEIKPVPASKPVESKSADAKPSNEAKPNAKNKIFGSGVEKESEKPDTNSKLPNPNSSKKGSVHESKNVGSNKNLFVRLEKSDGNKATLVVSGPKLGSRIKITITSKGSKK